MERFAFASLLCCALCLPAQPAAADLLSVELSGAAVPCVRVEHVIERRQGTLVARVGKYLAEGFGRREAVGLLTDEEWTALVGRLNALEAFSLASVKGRNPRALYRVQLETEGARHRFEVADPGLQPDGRHQAVINLLREAVEARTGPVTLQDDSVLPEEAGQLQVLTDLPARVRVDGVWLEGVTPIRGVRLPAGDHALELMPVDGGAPYRYNVRVDAGRTTSLNVQLK